MPAPARLAALRASTPHITARTLNAIHRAIVTAARALRDRTAAASRAASLASSPAASKATSLAASLASSRAASKATSLAASLASSPAASKATSLAASLASSRAASKATSLAASLASSRAASKATSLAASLASSLASSLAACRAVSQPVSRAVSRAVSQAASRAASSAVGSATLAGASAIRSSAARASYALPARARIAAAAAAVLALAAAVTAAAIAIGPAAAAGPIGPAIAAAALRPAAPATPGQAPVSHSATDRVAAATAPHHHRAVAQIAAQAVPAHHSGAAGRPAHRGHRHQSRRVVLDNWHAIAEAAAGHPRGGPLAPAQRLLPAALAGGQAALPLTPARAANAAVITAQALRLHMGIRSAVIAVATAMQESTLENLGYGDRDSLGLFQQRPSMGWGTPAQVTDPVYASDAFLNALRGYQAADPGWATQPLWEAAQGVQNSGFPYAYAQWEDQAAHIVAAVTRHLL